MQQNKVSNTETQVPQSPQMNERDFVNDILSTEKYLTSSYSTTLNELSHQSLYQDILSISNETQNAQRDLFNLMFKNGWYKLEAAEAQKIDQSYNQFSGYIQQQSPYGTTMQ